jgi:hypothetical protein
MKIKIICFSYFPILGGKLSEQKRAHFREGEHERA